MASTAAQSFPDQDKWDALDERTKTQLYTKIEAEAKDAKQDKSGDAAVALAWALETGYGCARDDAAAVGWYETALARGSVRAAVMLGCRAYESKEYDKAREFFESAVAQGNDDAMWHLGRMCRDGHGAAADSKRAFHLFQQAAQEHGHPMAWNSLGLMFESAQDVQRAKECFVEAVKRGLDDGLTNLLRCNAC